MLSCALHHESTGMMSKHSVPLHEAIREAFEAVGLTQTQLAERLGVDQTWVSKLARGKWAGRGPTPDMLARIEEASGRPRGWILIRAGYIDEVADVESAIAVDPRLSEVARAQLLAYFTALVEGPEQRRAAGND